MLRYIIQTTTMANNITILYDVDYVNGYYVGTTYNPISEPQATTSVYDIVPGWYYFSVYPYIYPPYNSPTSVFQFSFGITVSGKYNLMLFGPGGSGGANGGSGGGSGGGGGAGECVILNNCNLEAGYQIDLVLPLSVAVSYTSCTATVSNNNVSGSPTVFTMTAGYGLNGGAGMNQPGNGGNGGDGGWNGGGITGNPGVYPYWAGGGGGNGGTYGANGTPDQYSGWPGHPGNDTSTSQSTVGAGQAGAAPISFEDGTSGYIVRGGSQSMAAGMAAFMIYYQS